ncbi:hypothetical protein T310_4829, partial [Rasamsonia emersonii CBS 393.64]
SLIPLFDHSGPFPRPKPPYCAGLLGIMYALLGVITEWVSPACCRPPSPIIPPPLVLPPPRPPAPIHHPYEPYPLPVPGPPGGNLWQYLLGTAAGLVRL